MYAQTIEVPFLLEVMVLDLNLLEIYLRDRLMALESHLREQVGRERQGEMFSLNYRT